MSRLTKMQHCLCFLRLSSFSHLPYPFLQRKIEKLNYAVNTTQNETGASNSVYITSGKKTVLGKNPPKENELWLFLYSMKKWRNCLGPFCEQLCHILVSKWGQIIFASSDDPVLTWKITIWRPMETTTALLWVLARKNSNLHKPITTRQTHNTKQAQGVDPWLWNNKHMGSFLELSLHTPPWAEVNNWTTIKCLSMVTRVQGCWSRRDGVHF